MAYMSKEHKAEIVKLAKPILEKYGMKATFKVDHHSTIVCTLKSGALDFDPSNRSFNEYYPQNYFSGDKLQFIHELLRALNHKNYDNSQPQYDYFDKGHYVSVKIGTYDKPYQVVPFKVMGKNTKFPYVKQP